MGYGVFGIERRAIVLRYAPLVIWIGVVLFLGSGPGSMSRTSLFVRPILEFLFPSADELTLQIYHGYIRKFAHFAEYAILAILTLRAIGNCRRRVVSAIILVAAVAVVDELNQSFNAARTASAWDVLLDVSGGLFATAVYWRWQRRRRNNYSN